MAPPTSLTLSAPPAPRRHSRSERAAATGQSEWRGVQRGGGASKHHPQRRRARKQDPALRGVSRVGPPLSAALISSATLCRYPARVDLVGISCYSSSDLLTWTHEGVVLSPDDSSEHADLHPTKVMERPKVLYNAKNDQ
jgi:hypothetical protein